MGDEILSDPSEVTSCIETYVSPTFLSSVNLPGNFQRPAMFRELVGPTLYTKPTIKNCKSPCPRCRSKTPSRPRTPMRVKSPSKVKRPKRSSTPNPKRKRARKTKSRSKTQNPYEYQKALARRQELYESLRNSRNMQPSNIFRATLTSKTRNHLMRMMRTSPHLS